MADVALLNPTFDAEVCREMIDIVADQLHRKELALVSTVLERDTYLATIGAAVGLRAVHAEMRQLYDLRFNK